MKSPTRTCEGVAMFGEAFRDLAPLSAASAAEMILEAYARTSGASSLARMPSSSTKWCATIPSTSMNRSSGPLSKRKVSSGFGRDLFASLHWRSEFAFDHTSLATFGNREGARDYSRTQ